MYNLLLSASVLNKQGTKVADKDSKSMFFFYLFDVHIRKTGKIKDKKWSNLALSWRKSIIEEAMKIVEERQKLRHSILKQNMDRLTVKD